MAETAQDPKNERIGLVEKLGYGIGDLPSGLYLNFFGAYLLYFFVDLGGVAPAAMALMLLLSRVFDAITDPVMGVISDRTRTKWGRYRPYILFGALPFGLTGFAIFAAPDGISPGWLLVWAYVTYGLTMLAFTGVNVPYGGLLGVISPSSEVRSNVTAYRMFFSASGGILVGARHHAVKARSAQFQCLIEGDGLAARLQVAGIAQPPQHAGLRVGAAIGKGRKLQTDAVQRVDKRQQRIHVGIVGPQQAGVGGRCVGQRRLLPLRWDRYGARAQQQDLAHA